MKMENHIRELLLWHNCVIIPGMGGFVTSYLKAEINNSRHLFAPPSKKIAFNKNLKNNDGLLANHIAIAENKSFEQAVKMIDDYSENSLALLNKGRQVILQGIGKLYFDKEQNLQFDPSHEVNLLIDSFGLSEFHSPLIKRQTLHKKIEKQFRDRQTVSIGRKPKLKKWSITTLVLAILAAIIWLPLQNDLFNDFSLNYSTLNPLSLISEPIYKPRSNNNSFKLIPSNDGLDEVTFKVAQKYLKPETLPDAGSPGAVSNVTTAMSGTTALSSNSIKNNRNESKDYYYVIGGCFSVLKNAENFIIQLKSKGFNAKIIDQHKGLYRVCYRSFTTKKEAFSLLDSLKKEENPEAWLLSY